MAEAARDDKGRFVSVKWSGSAQVQKNLKSLAAKFPHEVARALYQETEIEATECKRRCPVDTNALRSSIHVEGPVVESTGFFSNDSIYTIIVCGGPAAPYAIYVHEDLTKHHPVGQAKFIESTLLESRPYMAQRIARRIDLNRAAGF